MNKIDQALQAALQDPRRKQDFYELFLDTLFFIPTMNQPERRSKSKDAVPMIVATEGLKYLMLFDNLERLTTWAEDAPAYIVKPGHAIAETALPDVYWALNYGTEHSKQFAPDEITWLKNVVQQAKQAAQQELVG